jgi:hypothetical protein
MEGTAVDTPNWGVRRTFLAKPKFGGIARQRMDPPANMGDCGRLAANGGPSRSDWQQILPTHMEVLLGLQICIRMLWLVELRMKGLPRVLTMSTDLVPICGASLVADNLGKASSNNNWTWILFH